MRVRIHRGASVASFVGVCLLAGCEVPTMIATDGRLDAATPDVANADAWVPNTTCIPPLDLDGDGAFDDRCPDGTDCDDNDDTVHPGAPEVCGNDTDDDCDGTVDGATCVDAPGSSCASPTVVTTSSTIRALLHATSAPSMCGAVFVATAARHVIRIDLSAPSSVRMSTMWHASDYEGAVFEYRASCDGPSITCSERSTFGDVDTSFAFAELPAGSHFFEVRGSDEASPVSGELPAYDVTIEIAPPVTTPTNDTCEGALVIPATRGTSSHRVDLVAATAHLPTCSTTPELPSGPRDVFFRLDLTETSDVTLDFASEVPGTYGIALLSGACTTGTALRCVPELTEAIFTRSLPPGTYLIEVTGPDDGAGTLSVTLSAPTVARPGENCANPIPLVPGTSALDMLSDRDLDYVHTECGAHLWGDEGVSLRDIVYEFTLAAPSEVEVIVRGDGHYANGSIQSTCGTVGTVRAQRCFESGLEWYDAGVQRTRAARLPAGRYFVVVQGQRLSMVETLLRVGPPRPIEALTMNVDCASAEVLPTAPGRYLYSGSLTGSTGPIFRVDLAAPGRFYPHSHLFVPPDPEIGRTTEVGRILWARGCGGDEPFPGSPVGGVSYDRGTYYFEVEPTDGVSRYELMVEIGGLP